MSSSRRKSEDADGAIYVSRQAEVVPPWSSPDRTGGIFCGVEDLGISIGTAASAIRLWRSGRRWMDDQMSGLSFRSSLDNRFKFLMGILSQLLSDGAPLDSVLGQLLFSLFLFVLHSKKTVSL